jgi:hypothetical protein
MMPTDSVRPIHDVWLRPRRVFRELALLPVGRMDYLLGAAQGALGWLAWSRTQNAGATEGLGTILLKALLIGSLLGMISLNVMSAIYSRLGARAGGKATRPQVLHVLAYGGVPLAASLGIWIVTALLAGEAAFLQVARPEDEGFVVLLLRAQFTAHVLLALWSVLLQVMGFSEVQGFATAKAFGIWLLGQLVVLLAALFFTIIIVAFLPNS